MIEILSTGLLNTIQDLGRPGHLALGVSHGGAMDRDALATANLMLGNEPSAAGIEVALHPFRVRVHSDTAIAVTGADCPMRLDERNIPPWWAAPVRAGQILTVDAPRTGARSYIAFGGGLDVPAILGSRATDVKSGFGGYHGRGLCRGDRLQSVSVHWDLPNSGVGVAKEERSLVGDGFMAPIELRVLPAAEFHAFAPQALAAFTGSEWRVTTEANRMGYRLAGENLSLSTPVELLSHGIVPGTVQVPPSGQPMIQLADANTCGGYPKIATVIEADLWRLAQAPVGARLRFTLTTVRDSTDALRKQVEWQASFLVERRRLLQGKTRQPSRA